MRMDKPPCNCGEEQTMEHLLVCPLLPEPCTHEDLDVLNDRARILRAALDGGGVVTREEEEEDTYLCTLTLL